MNAISPASVSRRRRRIGVLLVAATGLAIGGWGVAAKLRRASAPALVTAQPRADVVVQVTATGTLSPLVTVEVGSQVSGRVKELLADFNSAVTKGQVIARIDPELSQNAITQAVARLRSAEASAARARALSTKAKIDHERMVKLHASQLVATADVDAALAERRSAASADAAAADLTSQGRGQAGPGNLTYHHHLADRRRGHLAQRLGRPDVAASLSAPTLFVIAQDLRKMEIPPRWPSRTSVGSPTA
jgi:HlyD family secretion protein